MEELVRDSYGKVGCIDLSIKTNLTNNKELDADLKELSDTLDDLYKECEVNEFVAEYLEQLTQEQIDSIRVYELTEEENEE